MNSKPFFTENLFLTIGFDSRLLEYGFREKVVLCPFAPPHIGIVGNSGSGKTYLTKLLLGRIGLHKECELILNDFKGVDFQFLKGSPNFYQYTDVEKGLDYVYQSMLKRMSGGYPVQSLHPIFFVWDEAAAYLTSLPKKEAELQKQKLSSLLMLGRGVSICCILALQRPDAEYFNKSRDNLGHMIMLGTLSEESKRMCAYPYKNILLPQPRGRGYLLTDGKAPRLITVPQIRDMNRLQDTIRAALRRSFD